MRRAAGATAAVLMIATAPKVEAAEPLQHQLPNGLRLIVEPRPGVSEVGVAVAYRVGQRDAPPGYRGLPHLAEHMAFRGTKHLPGNLGDRTISGLGGHSGASTDLDTTIYRQSVPREGLPHALWVESDRMGFLVEALTAEHLALEQDIVASELELRTGQDGDPGFVVSRTFPKGHPYYISPDETADVRAVDLPGLQGFLQRHYRPDLAGIAVVGDVDPEAVKAEVERYFGAIPRPASKPPSRVTKAPDVPCYAAEGSIRGRGLSLMVWRSRDPGPPGEIELLAALIGAEVSRLVHDRSVKIETSLQRWDLETLLYLVVRPSGKSLKSLQGPLRRTLGELGEGVTPRGFERTRGKLAFQTALRLEAPGDRAEAWARSLVSDRPSPAALEAGLLEVPLDAVLARARRLRGSRPDLWLELTGLEGRQMPREFKFHRTPCRRF